MANGMRIDQLNPTMFPSRQHVVAAMRNGQTVKLTVGQMLDLVIGAAPGALDTLEELAAAINDEENFAAIITNELASKLDLDGGNIGAGAGTLLTALGFSAFVQSLKGLTTAAAVRAAIGAPMVGGNVIAPHENLVVVRNAVGAIRTTADALLVKDANGNGIRLTGIDEIANIGASGADGLDTGSEAPNTWYYKHIIHDPSGPTTAGLLSLSATHGGLTLPSGYTHSALVGAARNDGSSNFLNFSQIGCDVLPVDFQEILSAGAASNYATLDLSAVVPPIAKNVGLMLRANVSPSSGAAVLIVAPDGSGTSDTHGRAAQVSIVSDVTSRGAGPLWCPILTPQQIKYRVTGTNARGYINLMRWSY